MNKTHPPLTRYDVDRTYQWNYDNAPDEVPDTDIPPCSGNWELCGLPVNSPLGIPAGPLLNGKWCRYYAHLGFDVLTYKTVRSAARPCYPLPNLLPVACDHVNEEHDEVGESAEMAGSWAVSFGMPSASPDVWKSDVRATKNELGQGQLLSVSVVGTVQKGWTMQQLADDYAICARGAAESGADLIETNFSCPNVSTCDGQLYQHPDDASVVTQATREASGDLPLLVKIGHVPNRDEAKRLLDAIGGHINGLAMTNSVATRVRGQDGNLHFDGQLRGICGRATLDASTRQVEMMRDIVEQSGQKITLIGVGGVSSADDVRRYLDAGASGVHMATSAMVDPLIAISIRQEMAS
jgi:dihydroorotate dehydrogenase (NAD+) catalytic subunit